MCAKRLFDKHLHEVQETYFQHLRFSLRITGSLWLAGAILLVYGLMPFVFEHAASERLEKISQEFTQRRQRKTS